MAQLKAHGAEFCRTPRGVRELKLDRLRSSSGLSGRTPRGVRELKSAPTQRPRRLRPCRTPRGVRELKWNIRRDRPGPALVALRVGCVS
mgnify:CR=1 FL=1